MRYGHSTERFARLSEEILRTIWEYNPAGATILGVHDYDDTLGDMSAGTFGRHADTFRRCMRSLQSDVDPTELSAEDQLDYHVALSLASTNLIILDSQRAWANNPSIYPSICVWGTFSLLMRKFAPLEDRMKCVLTRLRQVPDLLETSKANLCDPAPMFIQIALDTIKGALAFHEGPFIACANSIPSLTTELLAANDRAVGALRDYGRWLLEDVLPHAHGDISVGKDIYQQLLFESHYLTYTPGDLVKLAEGVLAESQAQITEIAAQIDPTVSWEQLVERVKEDHPPKEGLTEAYRQAFESARQFVIEHDLATLASGESLEVVETPSFERCMLPYAAYMPPAPFGTSRAGCLWVTPIDETAPEEVQKSQLLEHCAYSIPIIALHEGYPGHHLQLTRAMEVNRPLRKLALNDVFAEGWALYCEHLMREEGFYSDPRVQLFQMKDMIWRACRVLIDVGLHTGCLTIDDAVRMLVDTARMEEATAIAEVKRYTTSPTQPMAYLIGRMLLLDLRNRIKRSTRSAFNLKAFHDEVLSYGSVPLPLISARMMAQALPDTKGRFQQCWDREPTLRTGS
jgi:uncharacterized protein (DUF885 family)